MFGETVSFSKSVKLAKTFYNDTTLNVFDRGYVSGISISGDITFKSETGLVRIIVSDKMHNEFMVYESYPMITEGKKNVHFLQKCEESCFMDNFMPTQLRIEIISAEIYMDQIEISTEVVYDAMAKRNEMVKNINNAKLTAIKKYIVDNKLPWTADDTGESRMSYSEKKKSYGEKYNLMGREYYTGGIYAPVGVKTGGYAYYTNSGNADDFDWRYLHDATDSTSLYYDDDPQGTGWVTSVKCQTHGCWYNGEFHCNADSIHCEDTLGGIYVGDAGTCWIFGPVAQVEAMTNLYYNQHVDLDLSEQYIACEEGTVNPYFADSSYIHFVREGIPDETYMPYSGSLDNCTSIYQNSDELVWIDDFDNYFLPEANVQVLMDSLTDSGPICVARNGHGLLLIGWGTIGPNTEAISFMTNEISPEWYGYVYFKYKESMGPNAGQHNGFSYEIATNDSNFQPTHVDAIWSIPKHITTLTRDESDVRCHDLDGDGYYNWGIGLKPNHCPQCPDIEDGNDNNPSIRELNADGTFTIIGTYTESFENGLGNWVQSADDDENWSRHSGTTSLHPTSGPDSAQNGEYYIYTNTHGNVGYPYKYYIIESPYMDYSQHCGAQVDFYYHQRVYYYDNYVDSYLALQLGYKDANGNITWSPDTCWKRTGFQGHTWNHVVVDIPSDVVKVRFIVRTGQYFFNHIALDNITLKPIEKNITPLVINNNTTWTVDTAFYSDVIVSSGMTLNINDCTIKFAKDCKLKIEANAKLYVNSADLTSLCNKELWGGIVLLGNAGAAQNQQNQGYANLSNGTKIENAMNGISNADNTTNGNGGIVICEDVTFQNNAKAVHFKPYISYSSSQLPQYNMSKFETCTFTIDDDNALTDNGLNFTSHVTLNGVVGISFLGCTFENLCTNCSNQGKGIMASNSGFTVDIKCKQQPTPDVCHCQRWWVRPNFSGFSTAIECSELINPYLCKILRSDFENNAVAIKLNGTSNSILGQLSISLDNEASTNPIGIYLSNCTGYTIEENIISNDDMISSSYQPVGIKVANAGNDENLIYLNSFDNLQNGILVTREYGSVIDTSEIIRNYPGTGLQFKCNSFTNNANDVNIQQMGVVRSSIGSLDNGADNSFSDDAICNISNNNNNVLSYYYSNTDQSFVPDYLCSNNNNITKYPNAGDNDCDPTICNDDPISKNDKNYEGWVEYDKLVKEYSELLKKFRNAGYDTVLVNNDKGMEVRENILYAGSEMNENLISMRNSMDGMANFYATQLKDSEIMDLHDLTEWLTLRVDLNSKYMLSELYLGLGEYKKAWSTLSSISTSFMLTQNDQQEYNAFMSYFNVIADIVKNGRSFEELTDDEYKELYTIANTQEGLAANRASAILCFFYDECLTFEDKMQDGEKHKNIIKSHHENNGNLKNETLIQPNLYPNPGNHSIIIDISNAGGVFEMTSLNTGHKVVQRELQLGKNTVNTSHLSDGIYNYRIIDGDKVFTGKWIKQSTVNR